MNTSHKNHYNKWGFYLFISSIGFSCFWAFYFLIFKTTIQLDKYDKLAKETPAQNLSEQEQAKPWLSTENLKIHGKTVYTAQCALCHGAGGLGDGTPGLIPPPRNLVEGKWRLGGSSKALFITLEKGIEGTSMVSFKHLPVLDRWAVIHYIRSITNNKVPDELKDLEEFALQQKE